MAMKSGMVVCMVAPVDQSCTIKSDVDGESRNAGLLYTECMPAVFAIILRFAVYFGAMLVGAVFTSVGSTAYEWYAKRKKARDAEKRARIKREEP